MPRASHVSDWTSAGEGASRTAEAKGLMTAHQATIAGSAGYVAIERVRGTLDGRSGSFVLQHNEVLN